MRRRGAGSGDRGVLRWGRTVPAVIAGAAVLTVAGNVAVLVTWHAGRGEAGPGRADPGTLVSVSQQDAARQQPGAVAPLGRRLTPHLLIAGTGALPPQAVERARRLKGVAGVAVVDAAQAQVAGRRVGLLGVDPSSFRAFAPRQTAESDQLWQTVATGGLAVSFELGQDGSMPLGEVVPAGRSNAPGQVRVGAYASMGIGDVDAVVSRQQARALGMPQGNALVLSAPKTDAKKLGKQLKKILPRGTKIAYLGAQPERRRTTPRQQPQVTGRPDNVTQPRSIITGNMMTPTMRSVVVELNTMFGPFPVIGCFRSTGDPQDHGKGRACDFMESTAGRMPSASAQRHGDQVAQYAISNAQRLGISYVIWKQHIWNVRGGGWRSMSDRGSLTQNHYDHVHISVLR
ncbi:hypothetical protein ACFVH6_40000 [Spirillospora sp. NPDC127200]